MEKKLAGLKVAILVADGFEQSEMVEPRKALDEAGAKTFLISPAWPKVKSWADKQWREEYAVDVPLNKANPDDYDALLLPGGVINPDILRTLPEAIEFIKKIFAAGKPIGAECHGPWTLINAQAVKGHTMTSWPALEVDLTNAGAHWVDKETVTDKKLVTSRKPADIPVFNKAMIELFAKSLAERSKK
jgi:protease I